MKTYLILLLLYIPSLSWSQIHVLESGNGSITISPNGIRSKNPESSGAVNNLSLGKGALVNNSKGQFNLAIGVNALNTQSYANNGFIYQSHNVAIGAYALKKTQPGPTQTGIENLGVGTQAGYNNISGSYNTGVGEYNLYYLKTGNLNVALGKGNQSNNANGSKNTSIGFESLYATDTAGSFLSTLNTTFGNWSLGIVGLRTGIRAKNTALGFKSMRLLQFGIKNVSIATNFTKDSLYTGSNNVLIDPHKYFKGITSFEDKLLINNLIRGDFTAQTLKVNHKLKVGGTTDIPEATLHIEGNMSIQAVTPMNSSQNNMVLNGSSILRVSGGGSHTLTGISGGIDGMMLYIWVTATTDLVLANNNILSSRGNRIFTGFIDGNITITQGGAATLIYDGVAGTWRAISFIE